MEKPMKQLVIGLDCDDLLVENAYRVLDHYEALYNFRVDPAHFYEGTPEQWGVKELDEVRARIENYYRLEETAHYLSFAHPEAVEKVNKWVHEDGHKVHLISARSHFMKPITDKMADLYFPGCFQTITHIEGFNTGGTNLTKGDVCVELDVEVLGDDLVSHCEDAIEKGVPNAVVFGDYEWNRYKKLRPGMVRCISWLDFDLEIKRLATA
jgi:hypothetical protein